MKTCYLLLLVLITGCFSREPVKTGLEGKPLPAFNLLMRDSSSHLNTEKIPAGKGFVMLYISPQCPHCHAQMQDMVDHAESLKDISIYILSSFPLYTLETFSKEYTLNKHPNMILCKDEGYFFPRYFQFQGIPFIAVYGKDKKLNAAFAGEVDSKQLAAIARE